MSDIVVSTSEVHYFCFCY